MNSLIAGAALTLALGGAALAQPAVQFAATTLNLSAAGEVKATPDLASLSLGVTAEAPTAAQALRDNSQRMIAVIGALHALKVQDPDIRTSGLNVQARYAFVQGQPQRLTGYEAGNQVTITVHDIAELGALVDAAVTAGANQVNGVSFAITDPGAAEDEARLQAVKAVKAKADLYAQATGYHVSRLVSLSEGGGFTPTAELQEVVRVRGVEKLPPVSAGMLDVRVNVNAVYELTR